MVPGLEVPINPKALAWALRRARVGTESLAKAVGVKPERATAWLDGQARPTYRQAREIAQKLHVSLGQLLVPPPERLELPVPDLRRGSREVDEPSPELVETLYDALRKRDWWREHRGAHRLPFVGSFDWKQADPEDVAQAIRQYIPVESERKQARDWSDFLRRLSEAAENIGILVLRRGIVGYNTRRPLDPKEFSGFAIADPVAPVILINTQDYVARRIFTFAHELAHVWFGESAVDDNLELDTRHRLEALCDSVAAELLVPEEEFRDVWSGNPHDAADRCARHFWVSVWVAARRALDLRLISPDQFRGILDRYYSATRPQNRRSGRGDFHRNVATFNSPTFTKAVVAATLQGELTYKEAASLLGLNLATFVNYLERQT